MSAKLWFPIALAVMVTVAPVSATIIVVDWAGGGDHVTIQAGLGAASVGDTVLVMSGTYTGVGNINLDFDGTNCVLMGSGGSGNVTIDRASAGRAILFYDAETSACVLDGFSITNGANANGAAIYFGLFSSPTGSGIWCDDNFTLTNCIVAFGVGGEAVYCDGDAPYPSCSDIYGNAGGDWVGCLAGLDLVDDNLSEDPLFCDAPSGDFTIDVASPCTGANAPACGFVGSWWIGCDTPVQAESWGVIKALYR